MCYVLLITRITLVHGGIHIFSQILHFTLTSNWDSRTSYTKWWKHINDSKYFGQWASYQIRKIAGCACAGNAGNVFPRRRLQRKPLISDPGMHHGTCVTHVPWCMSGSLTCGDGENVPGIPGACAPAILRIWQRGPCHNMWHTGLRSIITCAVDLR